MRWFFLILILVTVVAVVGYGRRSDTFTQPPLELFNDMDRQYKLKYQKPSDFFANGQGARVPVVGTIPMGYRAPLGKDDDLSVIEGGFSRGSGYYDTGRIGDYFGDGMPEELEIDEEFLARGRERYEINCSPCHGNSGNGQGIVSRYWMIPPTANLVDFKMNPMAKSMPDGQIFWTITHGKGLMGPYKGIVNVPDRWAITAYVRALQAVANP
jgi:hypothetical protein